MKIIFSVILILILVSVIAVVVMLKTIDVNQYKTKIVQQASQALGRDVQMDRILFKFSFLKGVTLTIDQLSVADHPDFSPEFLMNIDSIHLNVDVAALLFKREILVSKIEILAPTIRLIRDKQGRMNIQTLASAGAEAANPPALSQRTSPSLTLDNSTPRTSSAVVEKKSLPRLSIKTIQVLEGSVEFTDRSLHEKEVRIPVRQIEVQVADFSLDKSFKFLLSASLWSEQKNIQINGIVIMNLANGQIRCDDMKFKTDLGDVSLQKMMNDVPFMADGGLKDTDVIQGKIQGKVDQMVAGQEGLLVLLVNGQLKEGKVKWNQLPFPIENVEMTFEVTESDVNIPRASLNVASGKITAFGRLDDYLKEQKFSYHLEIENLEIGQIIEEKNLAAFNTVKRFLDSGEGVPKPVRMAGKLNGAFDGGGQGLTLENLKKSLSGHGAFQMKDGKLEGLNVLRAVFSAISMIPGLMENMDQNLPDPYQEKLRREDTLFPHVLVEADIKEGTLRVQKAELEGDGFLLAARAALDFDLNLSLATGLYISADLSSSMAAASEELTVLLDENKQIYIPFKPYSGKLKDVQTYPDLEYLGKKIIKKKGADELKKLLRQALGREESADQPQPSGQSGSPDQPAPQGQEEKRPEDVIVDSIFKAIFKDN